MLYAILVEADRIAEGIQHATLGPLSQHRGWSRTQQQDKNDTDHIRNIRKHELPGVYARLHAFSRPLLRLMIATPASTSAEPATCSSPTASPRKR